MLFGSPRAVTFALNLAPCLKPFNLFARNLRFWSLLTFRGRCHWSKRRGGRPGDVSLGALMLLLHRAKCSLPSAPLNVRRDGRAEKSRFRSGEYFG